MIKTKSVWDKIEVTDGQRILISVYWPRSNYEKLVDLWLPELGSDLELMKNWGTRKYDWNFFKDDYFRRIERPHIQNLLKQIAEMAREENVTLIGHPKKSTLCHRSLLKDYLDEHFIYSRN